jgi:integrase/recombinase XerD
MATIKIILRKKNNKDGNLILNKDGELPITMRITKDRKTSFIYLGYSVNEKDWDTSLQRVKKSHPNHARLNNYIIKKLAEANDTALELETSKTAVSVRTVRNKIKPSAGSTFTPQAELYLQRLKNEGKYNQYTPDKSRVKHFQDFVKGDIAFQDITPALLERFKSQLIFQDKHSERSAVNHLVVIRSVFSEAIKNNPTEAKHYPFGKGKVKIKFPDSNKIGLIPEEVKRIEETELVDPAHNHARNLWLFSFYFAGMRVSDVFRLRWADIQDNRLHYSMGKNNKGGSLKVPDKALLILNQYEQYRENKDDLIFPELKGCDFNNKFNTQRTIGFKTSAIDKILRLHVANKAKIEKPLTMHIARHTFGNISGDRIHIQMLQKLYRHSSIITTMGYQNNFIHKDTDSALDLIINL